MPDIENLDPELREAVLKADEAYRAQFGEPLPITSGARTRAEQEGLFQKRGQPGVYMPLNPAQYPGREMFHTDAIDIGKIRPGFNLASYNLVNPLGARDPVHYTLARNKMPDTTVAPTEQYPDQVSRAASRAPTSTALPSAMTPQTPLPGTNLNQTLGFDISGVSKDAFESYKKFVDDSVKAKQEVGEIEAKIASAKASSELENVQRARQKTSDEIANYKAKKASFPAPEFHPTEENLPVMASLFSALGILGTMVGGKGQLGAMGALQSMTGMLNGWKQGSADIMAYNRAKFDRDMQTFKAGRDELLKDLELTLKEYALDKEEGDKKTQVVLAKYNNDYLKKLYAAEGPAGLMKGAQALLQGSATFERGLLSKILGEQIKTLGVGGVGEASSTNLLKELTGITAKTEKDATDIVNAGATVARIDKLLKIVADPEIRTGIALKLTGVKSQVEALLNQKGTITDDELKLLIDQQVTPTDKNAVFIKNGLFVAFDAEKAAQGGRLTVQMMKQGGTALDPKLYTKGGYIGVLGDRRKQIIDNLVTKNMYDQNFQQHGQTEPFWRINKLINYFNYQQPSGGLGVSPKTENIDIEKEREKVKKILESGKKDPDQVKELFKRRTGVDY
jgi:hypothetical protein